MKTFLTKKIAQLYARSEKSQSASLPLPALEFKQASDWDDVRGAFRLLYRNYLARGLVSRDPTELRFTQYNLLPDTATFVAKERGQIIATFSLVVDSEHFGLPMDELYHQEIAPLRNEGRKVSEISGLAVDAPYQPISIYIIMNLVKMLYTYAVKQGVTDFLLACHPKHGNLYERMFLFHQMGPFRTYEAINDAPAVALRLDLTTVKELYREFCDVEGFNLYSFFFSDEIFRCPVTSVRSAAFSVGVNRALCSLKPSIMGVLEAKSPGLVKTLTEWSLETTEKGTFWPSPNPDPAFVPA